MPIEKSIRPYPTVTTNHPTCTVYSVQYMYSIPPHSPFSFQIVVYQVWFTYTITAASKINTNEYIQSSIYIHSKQRCHYHLISISNKSSFVISAPISPQSAPFLNYSCPFISPSIPSILSSTYSNPFHSTPLNEYNIV